MGGAAPTPPSRVAALARGRMTRRAVLDLLTCHPFADGQPIYAVDASVWARCDAETSPERGYYYHPSRHFAGKPIVAGWAYQWINQLSLARDHGHDARRAARASGRGREQRGGGAGPDLVRYLPTDGRVSLFVFDAGYDPVQRALDLGEARVATLVRRRKNRCF